MTCYEENRLACDAHANQIYINFKLNSIRNGIRDENCDSPPPPVTMTTPPPAIPEECPSVTTQVTDSQFEEPNMVTSSGVPTQCRVTGSEPVAHCRYISFPFKVKGLFTFCFHDCSIFMHSHLRPIKFLNKNDGIQTCSLPGAWHLFRHQDLIVEVEGEAEAPPSEHTLLAKVRGEYGRGHGMGGEWSKGVLCATWRMHN